MRAHSKKGQEERRRETASSRMVVLSVAWLPSGARVD
jgi:hypothetical protein